MNALLLTPAEVSRLLSIGRTRCYSLIASGELPVVRVGRTPRVPLEGLQEWIREHTAAGKPDEVDETKDSIAG